MTKDQLIAYLQAQGIEYVTTGDRLRVMDKSLLPQTYRESFDERGFLKEGEMEDKEKQDEEAAVEAARKLTKEIDKEFPMGETEKEMTVVGLLNPEGDTRVPSHLESHEPKVNTLLEERLAEGKEGEDAGEPETETTPLRGSLPDDFPGKAALEAEGYTTYAKVRKLRGSDAGLTSVPGIGKSTAAAIDEIFAGEEA